MGERLQSANSNPKISLKAVVTWGQRKGRAEPVSQKGGVQRSVVRKTQHQKAEESLHEPSEDTAMARDNQIALLKSELCHITAFLSAICPCA